ncbi:MAG: hypothetical protein V3V31_01575 [Methylococcales bacterium]
MQKIRLITAILFIAQATVLLAAEGTTIGILYSVSEPPLDRVFQLIEEGIQLRLKGNGQTYRLNTGSNTKAFRAWADENHIKSIITLGKSAHRFIQKANWQNPRITGGLSLPPNEKNTKGISLFADPKKVYESLSDLFPSIRRVFVAGHTENSWFDAANQTFARPYFIFTPLTTNDKILPLVKYQWEVLETLTPNSG